MKKYTLIFLKSGNIFLSRNQYSDWKEIQEEYDDYMTSLDFETLLDVQNYIMMDFKLPVEKATLEINKLIESSKDTIEIKA